MKITLKNINFLFFFRIYLVEESDEASSVSTLSTIQHITPLATPTKGQSKRTTPRSSFSSHDRTKPQQSFDLAKLLDPFEQLEREFNWEDVTTLKPPSAFCSLVDVRGEDLQQKQEKYVKNFFFHFIRKNYVLNSDFHMYNFEKEYQKTTFLITLFQCRKITFIYICHFFMQRLYF